MIYQVIDTMTETEARRIIGDINRLANEIGRLLTELRDREGWRALGYQSWTAFLESDELSYSRKRLLEFVRTFPVTDRLREKGYEVNTEQALALAKYPEELQIPIFETVKNSGKPITADRIVARGEVYAEMVATGGKVTTRSGEQSNAENAYKAQREQQEIAKRDAKKLLDISAVVCRQYAQDDGDYIVLRLPRGCNAVNYSANRHVRLVIMEAA